MKNKKLPIICAVIIGIVIGGIFYFYGKYFSQKTENPFRVNPVISIIFGVVTSVGVVLYWRKE